ncbi:MAG: YoaK family protein [Sphingobium sp.]|uniref:YoaK family protein n=1 Tax=Sphingobium sp. TaxID=1912891 RepID=UPI0029B96220|nr:YoaK family protein [Sphingobium sp.]MDX3910403.1 YoaK family protein [Sphingobium sp.]
MNRYDKRSRALATCLSALAGYVDAIGFLSLGGFFVSFMSGNSTRLGVGLAQGSTVAVIAIGLIGTFLVGVIAGSFTGHIAGPHRRPAVLALVTMLLTVAAACASAGFPHAAIVAAGLAMGAENAIFESDGEVHIGLTYMTGTLVKLGQRITAALLGGERMAWAPYLLLWLGLVAGSVAGALVHPYLGLGGLWIAAGAAAVLVLSAAKIGPDGDGPMSA